MTTTINYVNSLIQLQEEKDYFVTSRIFKDLIAPGCTLVKTPERCSVDMYGCVLGNHGYIPFNVEIKERIKNEETLLRFPYAELKVSKFNNMKNTCTQGTKLFYTVLLNETIAYVYDFDYLDWETVETFEWEMKKTQFSNSNRMERVQVYNIPYSSATYTVSCSDYFKEWKTYYGMDSEKN